MHYVTTPPPPLGTVHRRRGRSYAGSRPEAESVCKQMVGKKDVISGRNKSQVVAIDRKLLAEAEYGPFDFNKGRRNDLRKRVA